MIKFCYILCFLIVLLNSCAKKSETSLVKENTPSESKEEIWEISQNKNEWGDKIEGKNAFTILPGQFSNHSTGDGLLVVGLSVKYLYDEKKPTLILRLGEKRGDNINNVLDKEFEGKARNEKGEIKDFSFSVGKDGFGFIMNDFNPELYEYLVNGGNIDIILKELSPFGIPTTYRFSIPPEVKIKEAILKIQKE